MVILIQASPNVINKLEGCWFISGRDEKYCIDRLHFSGCRPQWAAFFYGQCLQTALFLAVDVDMLHFSMVDFKKSKAQ